MLKMLFVLGVLMILLLVGSGSWGFIFMVLMGLVLIFMGFMNMEHINFVLLGLDLGGSMMSIGLGLLSFWVIS